MALAFAPSTVSENSHPRRLGKPFHKRRGWLFADTVAGAQSSANLYSLVETAKANVIDPYRYLITLFQKLPLANTADNYAALLSWNTLERTLHCHRTKRGEQVTAN
ncbi:hypothetical protein J2797_005039 [Paraburkholderia terricola]|nr:hypothetical protein [Paraburkholderia terricola]MDR6495123.1 hypothetical protein [Paraburkholderia terricola]